VSYLYQEPSRQLTDENIVCAKNEEWIINMLILESDPWVSCFMLDLSVSLFDNMQSCTVVHSFRATHSSDFGCL
jgi:hypothetical protein